MGDDVTIPSPFWCVLLGHWKHNCDLDRCRDCTRARDYTKLPPPKVRCPYFDYFEEHGERKDINKVKL